MFGGLSRQFAVGRDDTTPRTLLVPPECATLSGITIGGDGCPTNAKLFGHILAKVANEWLPESDGDSVQVALSSTCLQHAVALCKSHIASQLDINVPVFCIAKQFALSGHSQAAEAAAFHFVDSRLEWIKAPYVFICVFSFLCLHYQNVCQASEQPDWRPNDDHVKHAKDVIKLCSANRHFNRRRRRGRRGHQPRQFRNEVGEPEAEGEEVDSDAARSQWLQHCEELAAECHFGMFTFVPTV